MDYDPLASAKATTLALDATEAALARTWKVPCSWCSTTLIEVAHPQSSGICAACCRKHFDFDPDAEPNL
jgi:hypothetical protein